MKVLSAATRTLWVLLASLAASHGLSAAPAAPAAPPTVEDYARLPAIRDLAVSPAGTHLALVSAAPGGRAQLVIFDLPALGVPKVAAGFVDVDVTDVQWVNNDRLVFSVARFDVTADQVRSRGVLAVNRDGSGQRELIAHQLGAFSAGSHIESRVLPWQWDLHDTVDDGSPDVIVREHRFDGGGDLQSIVLSRLNTVSGALRSLSAGVPENPRVWLLDRNQQPRVITTRKDGRTTVHWQSAADKAWAPIAEFGTYSDEGFTPRFIDGQGHLYVIAHGSRDTAGLYQFDPVAKKMEAEPTTALQGFDLNPSMVVDPATKRLLGMHVHMEQWGSYWFDKDLRKIQQGIDAAMPAGRVNRLWCGRCASSRFLVVESSSDQQPGEYFLLDRETWKLQFIASSRPWIKESSQGRRSYHRVSARDGLSLPVYLTHPAAATAKEALPAVVLVHGGPYVRGHDLGWSQEAQFLASRGYLVIEVDFRGSTGYGLKHFRAALKQWGQAMQDDLADAVAWAARQGLADPRRVCIMGGSYGGYAALMGPIRHPDVYKCAVSFAAVTDIELMYSNEWSDFHEDWKQYGMPALIGDRRIDADQLKNTSPLQQVSRIKVPLLVAHGALDRRVPIDHSRKFRAAAEKAGVSVEWVMYPDEMHGFRHEVNEADYLKRVDAFLARALGTPSPSEGGPRQ